MDTYETSLYTAIVMAGAITGFALVYFALSLARHQRRQNRKQKAYYQAELKLLEKERSRIAHDLHDELGPILSLVKLQLGQTGQAAEDAHLLRQSEAHIDTVIDRLGGIARNLRPSMLATKGLALTLRAFLTEIEQATPLQVQIVFEPVTEPHPDVAIQIYRMVQELVHNTVKHAQASRATLQMKEGNGNLYLLYSDDGKGFEDHYGLLQPGLGLKSISSRATIIGGTVHFTSTPLKGVEYLIKIPLVYYDDE